MKQLVTVVGLVLASALAAQGQSGGTTSTSSVYDPGGTVSSTASAAGDSAYSIVERGPHHRVWERIEYEPGPEGRQVPRAHRYVELATGLHYWSDGQWKESQELIEPYPGGAVARHGQHKVIFAYNLATACAIDMELPDGKRLRSHVLGLAYFDAASGKTVLIAEVKDCVGVIVEPNRVLYQDAFEGLRADVRYTYTLAGFEQDVILHERPLGPEAYGLDPSSSRLQVWTEFVDGPEPKKERRVIEAGRGHEIADETLDFGSMQVGSGKAFTLGEGRIGSPGRSGLSGGGHVGDVSLPESLGRDGSPSRPEADAQGRASLPSERAEAWGNASLPGGGVRVGKQWLELDGRRFLVEEVLVRAVQEELEGLPVTARPIAKAKPGTTQQLVSGLRQLPEPRQRAEGASKAMQLASAGSSALFAKGFVLDYVMLNSSQTNYTFRGDTTYFVSGTVNLYGATTFEGGTVIKYTNSWQSTLRLYGPIECRTGPYRPAVFTSMHDNSVGETIAGSTGNPAPSSYGVALNFVSASPQTLSHVRLCYATTALVVNNSASSVISGVQFVNCACGLVNCNSGSVTVDNSLFSNMQQFALNQYGSGNVVARNVTFNWSSYLCVGSGNRFFTNCIVANVSNTADASGTHNGFYNSPPFGAQQFVSAVYPFQVVGGGAHYLVDASGFRNVGTTNISPSLLAELRCKTTYPPIAFTNVTFTDAMVFSPQAQRDTDIPDLGYHYDPLDYIFGGCHANSNITFTAGTAAGWFRTSSGWYHAGYGIRMGAGVTVSFEGSVTEPVWWVRLNTAQEQDRTGGYGHGGLVSWTDVNRPVLQARFMRAHAMAGERFNGYFADDWGSFRAGLNHCEFWSGNLHAYGNYIYYTNCLMWRVGQIGVENGNNDSAFVMRNCTVIGGTLLMRRWVGPTYFSVRDCAFDGVSYSLGDYYTNNPAVTDFDYNACSCSTNPFPAGCSGTHIMTGVVFNWQKSWLGDFYLPTNSLLTNAGSCTADLVGLYHFTTQTNQVKETNSQVDIGYHYVALDANGILPDSDSDGIPDYCDADSDGDDLPDWWELVHFGDLSQIATDDYDSDGTNNIDEYTNGSDPNTISFGICVTNYYVNVNPVPVQLVVVGGVPASMAVLVDNTNFAGANWFGYNSNLTVNLGTNEGWHSLWVGLRGRMPTSQQTWQGANLYLDTNPPVISITSPIDGAAFNSSRVNVRGSFTETSLKQIAVNGVRAFVSSNSFDALNVPLAAGSNTITAIAEDFAGGTATATITVTALTNVDGTLNDPVQLQATPIGGFAPLQVTFQPHANAPGTIQQVLYDFNGDNVIELATNNLQSLTRIYADSGQYFPVITLQTTVGWFSSLGGWHAADWERLRINVQVAPVQLGVINVTDPVDLKWTATSNLYVLSRSTATITEFDANGNIVRSVSGIGTTPMGLDVDSAGNVYVALSGNHQVAKYNPTDNSFQLDASFGTDGRIGSGTAGNANGQFNAPFDVAVSPDGEQIAVSDSGNHRIQRFTKTGTFVSAFGQQGSAPGQFNTPKGLAYDSVGYLYIVDSGNNRIVLTLSSAVIGASGTSGSALGQFNGPVNLGVGARGIYVGDAGNNRVQAFDPLGSGQSPPFNPRLALANQFSPALSQPHAAAPVADFLEEKFYIADTGNNRVLLVQLPFDTPEAVWNAMKARLIAGDIDGAIQYFSSTAAEDYRETYLAIGTAELVPVISEIPAISPIFIENEKAQYYFQQPIEGVTITFPIEFVKENGIWKILEY